VRAFREIDGKVEVARKRGEVVSWERGVYRECVQCGQRFAIPMGEANRLPTTRATGKLCSNACTVRYRVKLDKQRRVRKRCPVCMQFFKVSRAKATRLRTCGEPKCKYEYKSQLERRIWQERRDAAREGKLRENWGLRRKGELDRLHLKLHSLERHE
jgi:ribosomal protein S27AE